MGLYPDCGCLFEFQIGVAVMAVIEQDFFQVGDASLMVGGVGIPGTKGTLHGLHRSSDGRADPRDRLGTVLDLDIPDDAGGDRQSERADPYVDAAAIDA